MKNDYASPVFPEAQPAPQLRGALPKPFPAALLGGGKRLAMVFALLLWLPLKGAGQDTAGQPYLKPLNGNADSLEAEMAQLREKHLHPVMSKGFGQDKEKARREWERAFLAYSHAHDSLLFAAQQRRVKQQQGPSEEESLSLQSVSTTSFDLVPDSVELKVLRELYDSTNGPGWRSKTNWLVGTTSADFATWYGVTVSNGDISQIDLSYNSLSGVVPSSLGRLSNLQFLSLGGTMSGTIPSSLGRLRNLQYLNISSNFLSSAIPDSLGNLVNVETLVLSLNGQSGTIPSSLGRLRNMRYLDIYATNLSGSIPDSLSNLTNLQSFSITSNYLGGTIPSWLGSLTNLQRLSLFGGRMGGSIPETLGNLTNLQTLSITGNGLDGAIPSSLSRLSNLQSLSLSGPNLSGVIPSWPGSLTKLEHLYLGGTKLSGSIPDSLSNLTNLKSLFISGNSMSGTIPSWLGSLTNLESLSLLGTLSGSIPDTLLSLPKLRSLVLFHNNLSGSMPVFSSHPNKSSFYLQVYGNRLDFGSIEPNMSGPGQTLLRTFSYSPQGPLGEARAVEYAPGEPLELEAVSGGTLNLYQWERQVNGVWQQVAGATSARYMVPAASSPDAGAYRCRVTNEWATALTLYTHEYAVTVLGDVARLAPNLPTGEDCQ